MSAYCTAQDAGDWLGPENAEDPYRDLANVDPDTDALELSGHHLATGDTFEVRALGGTVAGGLAERVEYYAIVLTRSRFQAAASAADAAAGIPIDITDSGEGMGVVLHIPWDRYIRAESAFVSDMMPGNALPLPDGAAVPPVVSRYTSILVAMRAAAFTGQQTQALMEHHDRALDLLRNVYLKGQPIREQAPPATMKAVSGPRLSGTAADSRGWRRANSRGQEVL
jgi:hypothetical protein